DEDYSRVFRSMATGIREADPKLKIATCNINARKSGKYHKTVDCVAFMPDLVDVLTIHSYPQLEGWPTWKRSFPEDPKLTKFLPDITDLCSWRDKHMPGKPVWITEFGYDSTTKPNNKSGTFAKWQGVSDKQQAQWLVRSFLIFSSLPVDRAYLYFFNDSDKPSVHASSGLTRDFKPKPSFHAVSHLYNTLGDYRFERIVKTDSAQLRAHDYRHSRNPKLRIRVCWTATGNDTPLTTEFNGVSGKLVSSSRMPLDEKPVPGGATQPHPGTIHLTATGSPLYLMLEAE
ncbi:MAG: hypothetical protein ACQCXQ_05940, partial [Verrucomicrobiales bacterium]